MAKFSEVLTIINGRNQKEVENPDGKYPIYGSGGIMGYANDYLCLAETVVIGRKGSINKPIYVETPFWNVDTAFGLCADRNKLLPKYLYYFCEAFNFEQLNTTVTIPSLTKANLLQIEISLPQLTEQLSIVECLDKVVSLITKRKQQLAKLDELVKSRFIEMFGTVEANPFGFPTATLKEVCRKITDGKHGGCEQEAGSGYYYVGAREIYDGEIHYDSAPEITYSDFAKDYRRCNIECGDMVIVNTGATIGKTAIATSPLTTQTLLQKSVALIKVQSEIISAEFLRHCYMANPSMYMVESASAQPNLLLSKMNATRIYLPPMERQVQFASFVEQTDKSKLAVQKSLEKLETLKKSLMQQYFG